MITIRESTIDDIKNIQSLWADADVMKYSFLRKDHRFTTVLQLLKATI